MENCITTMDKIAMTSDGYYIFFLCSLKFLHKKIKGTNRHLVLFCLCSKTSAGKPELRIINEKTLTGYANLCALE